VRYYRSINLIWGTCVENGIYSSETLFVANLQKFLMYCCAVSYCIVYNVSLSLLSNYSTTLHMGLSQRVRCCRKDKGISQEYMAEGLCMSQSSYSRLEHDDAHCEQRISRLAALLGVGIEALRTYGPAAPDAEATLQEQLTRQQQLLSEKSEEISFLRGQLQHLQAYVASLLRGGGNSLIVNR
jgi:transcriptional regulator with XRE-family HTH domain